ncbi:MAG TPA: methyltransferase [Pseudonocardiaceae bacterium]|nr:methyltransferase [Pseudonocardiaceae bacterium]
MSEPTTEVPDMATFLPIVFGYAVNQIAGSTGRLGIPDLIGDSTKTAEELAVETGTEPQRLYRLLRAATAIGVLRIVHGGRFELTSTGRLFRSDSPWHASLHDAMHSHPAVWRAWGALEDSVRTGKPAFDLVNGASVFSYLERDPKLSNYFHATMAAGTALQLPAILANYDFSGFTHIVDVGGGNGTFLSAILAANQQARGTLFDTAGVLAEAPSILAAVGVADRCEIIASDFFDSIPGGADAYLLKSVLHDWDDESCIRIMANCRKAMAPNGKVVVLTSIIPEDHTTGDPTDIMAVFVQDIEMMVMCPGAIRTITEHERMFVAAGLKLGRVVPLSCPFFFHAVEGLPA